MKLRIVSPDGAPASTRVYALTDDGREIRIEHVIRRISIEVGGQLEPHRAVVECEPAVLDLVALGELRLDGSVLADREDFEAIAAELGVDVDRLELAILRRKAAVIRRPTPDQPSRW